MRLNRVWGFVLPAIAAVPSLSRAQGLNQITVQYESAQLSQVVENFARFAGRAIDVGPGVDDQLVTTNVRDLAWDVALDQILATKSLVARPHRGGGLQIERERKLSVDFEAAPLSSVLQSIAGFAGRAIVLSPVSGDPWVTVSIRDTDWQRALNQVAKSVGFVARADRDGVFHVEKGQ
jgi:hypothetical protein